MRARSWVLALLTVGLLAACGDGEVAESVGNPGGPGAEPAGEYLSTAVVEDGKPRELVAGTRVLLAFRDGQISASAGCNSMGGSVEFRDGRLFRGDFAITEKGCSPARLHEQDAFVADFLARGPAYTLVGSTLELRTETASMTFGPREVVEPDLPLEETSWEVTQITQGPVQGPGDDPNATVSAEAPPSSAFLVFADGRVTGGDGCNRVMGEATIAGDTITFGPIATTKRGCPGVRGDQDVRAVLAGTVTWRIRTDILTFEHPSGTGLQLQAGSGGAACDDAESCRALELKDDECERAGTIVASANQGSGGQKSGISDYASDVVGANTPSKALYNHGFSRAKPASAYAYAEHRIGEDTVIAQRLIDDRVVATASVTRTTGGGWLVSGTTDRRC